MAQLSRIGLRPGIGGAKGGSAPPPPFFPTYLNQSLTGYPFGAYPALGAQYGYHARSGGLVIYDQSDMSIVGALSDGTNLNGTHHCVVNDAETYAYCECEGGASLTSVDISNKAAPVIGQRFRGPSAGTSLNGASDSALDGNTVAVACYTRDSVAFVDVTNPVSMSWLSEFRGATGGTTLNQCRRVSLDTVNKVCYYCCDATGAGVHRLGAIDYSTPTAPVELWFIATGGAGAADVDAARGVFWDPAHSLLWVCSSGGTPFYGAVTVYQVDTLNLGVVPTKIGQFKAADNGATSFSDALSLTGTRSLAFVESGASRYAAVVAETPNNITVLDVTDPTNITRLGYRKDTSVLNQPLGILIGAGGAAFVTGYASNGNPVSGVSKWNLQIP